MAYLENGEMLQRSSGQYLSFELAGERYALNVAHVEVVIEMASITRVPRSSSHLCGVMNHRGSVIPVLDLRTVFNLPQVDSAKHASIIVTRIAFQGEFITTGVLADMVYEVVNLDPSIVEPSPSIGAKVDASCIAGLGKRDGGFLIILDLEKVITMAVSKLGSQR